MSKYIDIINNRKLEIAIIRAENIDRDLRKILNEFATCDTVNFSFYRSYYLSQPIIDIPYSMEVAQLLKDDGFTVVENQIKEYTGIIKYYTATIPEQK